MFAYSLKGALAFYQESEALRTAKVCPGDMSESGRNVYKKTKRVHSSYCKKLVGIKSRNLDLEYHNVERILCIGYVEGKPAYKSGIRCLTARAASLHTYCRSLLLFSCVVQFLLAFGKLGAKAAYQFHHGQLNPDVGEAAKEHP